jgi:gamma-glutamyltranspeptidase/glutathione hydrolase
MDDFTSVPGRPNLFGLVQGEPNTIAPRKRMLSSMTPTIVLDGSGRVRLVLGSPGGPTIITTVAQVISNVIDFEMSPAEAVAAPRLHHQHLPDELRAETNGLREEVIEELRAMGHSVTPEWRRDWGDVELVAIEPDGTVIGISDPRRGGSPAAVRP